MKFSVNSFHFETKNSISLQALIQFLNLKDYPIVIEKNSLFLKKEDWKNVYIRNNDKIEIVTLVGGG